MQDDPRQEVDQSNAAREQSHHDRDVQSTDGEDEQVVGQDPHQAEEGTATQELDRSDSLAHQVIQAFPVKGTERHMSTCDRLAHRESHVRG